MGDRIGVVGEDEEGEGMTSKICPHWAQVAKISWNEKFEQFEIEVGFYYGKELMVYDTLWTRHKDPEALADRHYPGIKIEDFRRCA